MTPKIAYQGFTQVQQQAACTYARTRNVPVISAVATLAVAGGAKSQRFKLPEAYDYVFGRPLSLCRLQFILCLLYMHVCDHSYAYKLLQSIQVAVVTDEKQVKTGGKPSAGRIRVVMPWCPRRCRRQSRLVG